MQNSWYVHYFPRTGLSPKDPVEPLAEEMQSRTADTLIVGHLPFLGRLASLLLAADADRPTLALQPDSMACLERDAGGHWVLARMIRTEILNSAQS